MLRSSRAPEDQSSTGNRRLAGALVTLTNKDAIARVENVLSVIRPGRSACEGTLLPDFS